MPTESDGLRQDISASRDAYTAVNQTIHIHEGSPAAATAAVRLRVYVSSTYDDLRECRLQVSIALQQLGVEDVSMETFTSDKERRSVTREENLQSCDVYLGVFAWRYGRVPDGHDVSATESDYEAARAAGLTRLIFLHDELEPWPPIAVDRGEAFGRIEALRARLREQESCEYFRGADDLRAKVFEVLTLEMNKRDRAAIRSHPGSRLISGWDMYKRRLAGEYRRLDLDALTPPEREEYLQIGLREVFVEPSLREDVPPPELPKELLAKVQGPAELSGSDVPRGIDRQDLERARQSYRARPAEPAFDVLAQVGAGLTVLLGDPGAGKSTLARYVALALAEDRVVDRLSALRGYQPVLVELRDYAASRDRHDTFLEYLSYRARSDRLGVDAELLETHLRLDGRVMMIFDGLDELFDLREREAVSRQIAGFAAVYPSARVLVTSRVVGYRPRILREAGFRHFTIQELDPRQIDGFLESWYRLALHDRPDMADERRKRLADAIKDSPSIREIAGNPLLLTILAIIGKHQELPRERWKVYDHAASVLVQHWDVNKHLQDSRVEATVLREDDKKELLRRLAYRMQSGSRGLAGNHIWHDELASEIEDYLRVSFGYDQPRAAAIAHAMIDQFRERNFVLARYGSKVYGFVHRALLEFFCAGEIVTRFEKARELTEDELMSEVFDAHWEDLAWSEVLRLIAGMVGVKVADRLITHLVTRARPTHSSVLDRPPLDAVVIATQCLVEIRNLGAASSAAAHTLHALIETLSRPSRSFADDREARLESAIGPAVEAIGARWPGREAFLEWFDAHGARTGVRPASLFAARFAAALFPDSDVVCARLEALAIHSPISDQRRASMTALAEVWAARTETFDIVLRATRDPIIAVRQAAIEDLIEKWPDEPRILATLHERVSDYDPGIRKTALEALSLHWTADPETLPLIHRALVDGAEDVRMAVLQTLASRWPVHPETLPAVHRAISFDPHWKVRKTAVGLLMDGWSDHIETLPTMLRAAREIDEDVREAALEAAAGRWAEHPDVLPAVQRAVGDIDEDVRLAAVGLLATRWADHPGTPRILEQARRDFDGTVRYAALSALARRSRDLSAFPDFLGRMLSEPDAAVRRAALQALAADWSEHPSTVDRILRAAQDPDMEVREAALSALADHWTDDAEAYRIVLAVTRDARGTLREAALKIIAKYWNDRPGLRAVFEEATGDEDWTVRRVAVEALTTRLEDRKTARCVLAQAARDSAGAIRQSALEALVADPEWVEGRADLLDAAMRDAHGGTRDAAFCAIFATQFGSTTELSDRLEAAYSPVPDVRAAALRHLVACDPVAADTWAAVEQAMHDPDSDVRRMAFDLTAMWRMDTQDGKRIVLDATRDPAEHIRAAAIQAVAAAWPDELDALHLVDRALLDEDTQVRMFAVAQYILHRREDKDRWHAVLVSAAQDTNILVHVMALKALVEGWNDTARVPPGFDRILRAESATARRSALTALVTCWPQSPEAFLEAERALKDSDESVRTRALDTLAACWPDRRQAILLIEKAIWDPSLEVARFARNVLTVAGRSTSPVTPAEAFAQTRSCNPATRAVALESLIISSPDSAQCRRAVQLALFDESPGIQAIALDAICLRWETRDVFRAAATALEHPDSLVRYRGLQLLSRISPSHADAHERLTRVLDDIGVLRHVALEVLLTRTTDEKVLAGLLQRVARDPYDPVREMYVHRLARQRLAGVDIHDEMVIAARDPAVEVRGAAVQYLATLWPGKAGTSAVLARAARDPASSVRETARSWETIPGRPLRSAAELRRVVAAGHWTERSDAVRELSRRWPDDPATHDTILSAARDLEAVVRSAAISVIDEGRFGDASNYAVVVGALNDPDEAVRLSAVYALAGRLSTTHDPTTFLIRMLNDVSWRVRSVALIALARILPEFLDEHPEVLLRALRDSDWLVRREAFTILRHHSVVSETELRRVAADNVLMRKRVDTLLAREADTLSTSPAELLALRAGAPGHAARAAEYTLVTRWPDLEIVLPVLRESAAGSDPVHRIWALQGLVTHWKDDPSTLPLLQAALSADNVGVREIALRALAVMEPKALRRAEAERACMDSDAVIRIIAREVMDTTFDADSISAELLKAALYGLDPETDQHWAVVRLGPWRTEDPSVRGTLEDAASRNALTHQDRAWLRWLYEEPEATADKT